jgi:hypothetical protein
MTPADRYGQTSLLVRHRSCAERRWGGADQASALGCLAGCRCSGRGADNCRNVSSIGQPEIMSLGLVGLEGANVDWQYDHRLDRLGPCRRWRLALVRQPHAGTDQKSGGGNGITGRS